MAGCDVNAVTEHGFTADEVAANSSHDQLATLIHALRQVSLSLLPLSFCLSVYLSLSLSLSLSHSSSLLFLSAYFSFSPSLNFSLFFIHSRTAYILYYMYSCMSSTSPLCLSVCLSLLLSVLLPSYIHTHTSYTHYNAFIPLPLVSSPLLFRRTLGSTL